MDFYISNEGIQERTELSQSKAKAILSGFQSLAVSDNPED